MNENTSGEGGRGGGLRTCINIKPRIPRATHPRNFPPLINYAYVTSSPRAQLRIYAGIRGTVANSNCKRRLCNRRNAELLLAVDLRA